MAIGKISGPLLKENLLRDGVDLAFETDLLYFDVNNRRIGVKTSAPTHDLTVNGTTRTTNLEVTTTANIADITISGNQIYSNTDVLTLSPAIGAHVVYQNKLIVDNIQLEGNQITAVAPNTDLEFITSGTGQINLNADTQVFGNLHATGTITADGNLTLGDADTDSIDFKADIASNIIPDATNTYSLGAAGKQWNDVWVQNLNASSVTAGNFEIDGIDITLRPGNLYYVSVNGDDGNTGTHQNDPLSSVGRALDLAIAGDTVYIYPGVYSEALPLTVPAGVVVKGAGIRSVTIQPDSDVTVDVFLLNGETTVEDLTITGFEYDAGTNTGYAFRFANNMTVTSRSPYIRNISVITAGSTVRLATNPADDPRGFLAGDAGKGAYIDGSIVNAASREASMLFNNATFITPGVDAITTTDGARVEWLNSFSYFANRGIYSLSGSTGFAGAGQTRLRIDTRIGSWNVGNTVRYYDTDGTTILASGVIDSIDGNYINLTGKCLGFETITDRTPTTLYAQGGAALSTAEKKWGTSSLLLDGIGDYVTHPTAPDFGFGTGAFCVEAWVYNTATSGLNQIIFDFRSAAPQVVPTIYIEGGTGHLHLVVNGPIVLDTGVSLTLNTWTHIAVARSGTSTKFFKNGIQIGATYTDTNNYIQAPLTIGARFDGTSGFNGYIDDVRISKGVARYTSNFTAPTQALTGDLDTVLLLHFDGLNGSTTFLDNGITFQDVRNITTGGTASIINFTNYSDFGAEIRSISSANVYGNYGVYADGVGNDIVLLGHNFSYVGTGRLSNNDPTDAVQNNEVTALNGAHVHYDSIDQIGNFRVGDYFEVEQSTGNITFSATNIEIASPDGVTFTDGINVTTVEPTKIETGNIRISGNTIESTTGGLIVTASNNEITATSNVNVSGTLTVTDNITVSGNTTIGDNSSDLLTVNAQINTSVIPSSAATYDLGTASLPWRNVYTAQTTIDSITITGNRITTNVSNTDLELAANGTGVVSVPNDNLVVDQNLTVLSGTSTLNSVAVTGTLTVNNLITNSQVTAATFSNGNIQISGNVITTTLSNSNLELRSNGTGAVTAENLSFNGSTITGLNPSENITITPSATGIVNISSTQALKVPVGTDLQRPLTPQSGMIRFNSTTNRYEGYTGTQWIQLGGVSDVDGNTYIVPEVTPGSNENTLYFYANGSLAATLNNSYFDVNKVVVDQIEIDGNQIRTTNTNTDLNLLPNGTGAVAFDNLKFGNSTITNTVSGAITEFKSTGTGYYRIVGNNAFVIPAGISSERPGTPITGMMRYNIELGLVEVYDGLVWGSVAGSGAGITSATANEIAAVSALIFG